MNDLITFNFKDNQVRTQEVDNQPYFCLTDVCTALNIKQFLADLIVMISGVGMGLCYYLGTLLCKLKDDGKCGWNWGEWIFGAYMGVILAWRLLW